VLELETEFSELKTLVGKYLTMGSIDGRPERQPLRTQMAEAIKTNKPTQTPS
jgi:hypothetical protein